MSRISGKVVLVTGGSRGIGRETARKFAAEGARVCICGRNQEALTAAAESIGGSVSTAPADISDPDQCRKLIDTVKQRFGRLDVLINNAGMSMRGSVYDTDPRVVKQIFDINTAGAVAVTHYALPLLRKSKGSVIFISSISAFHGLPNVSAYCASKIALRAIAESLRAEEWRSGIHVGLIYVGFTTNDADKNVYDAQGQLMPIHRPNKGQSQQRTAGKIFRCAIKRRKTMILTTLGHFSRVFFAVFPRLSGFIIRKAAGSRMYGDR